MQGTSRHPKRLVGALLTGALAFAACGGGSDDTAPGTDDPAVSDAPTTAADFEEAPTDSVSDSVLDDAAPGDDDSLQTDAAPNETDPGPVDTASVPAETDAAPAETEPAPVEADPGSAGGLPDCLIGDWIVDDAEMNSYYMAVGENSGAGLEITVDGNMLITMTATDYVFTGDYSVNLEVAGQSGTGDATGTARGTWTVEDGVIQSALEESDLNLVVTVAGITLDASDIGNSLLQSDPFANTPVSCDGPTLMLQAGATEDIRHPVVLTPA